MKNLLILLNYMKNYNLKKNINLKIIFNYDKINILV